jgi:probable HAF family extracellular repeat protein
MNGHIQHQVFMKSVTLAIMMFLAVSAKAEFRLFNLGALGGPLPPGVNSVTINDRGEIIGNDASTKGIEHAFYYWDGAFHSLGTNPCVATAINDAGRIVGSRQVLVTNVWYSNPGGPPTGTNVGFAQQPVVFRDGSPVNLFPGINYGDAAGINDNGEIVGSVSLSNELAHGFAYVNGVTTDLGSGFQATGINNCGDIVGQGFPSPVALLYHGGVIEDLGTLGGSFALPTSINDLAEVVGWSATTSNAENHAFLYRDGTMTDLGALGPLPPGTPVFPGGPAILSYSYAFAINNWGQVVGASTSTNGQRAFLYWDGTMVDLNCLVKLTHINGPAGFLALTSASSINDRGQIVGEGSYWDGTNKTGNAFLLDLHPERRDQKNDWNPPHR